MGRIAPLGGSSVALMFLMFSRNVAEETAHGTRERPTLLTGTTLPKLYGNVARKYGKGNGRFTAIYDEHVRYPYHTFWQHCHEVWGNVVPLNNVGRCSLVLCVASSATNSQKTL